MSNAQQMLGRLTELVNTLSNQVTSNQQQPTNVPVADELRRLYPSVDRKSSSRQEPRPVNTLNAFRQSSVTASSNIFKPGIQYRTHSKSKKRKLSTTSSKERRSFLKDVYLLPSSCEKVPRGRRRENMSKNGCVAFAVEFDPDADESQLRDTIYEEFKGKMQNPTAFSFMKAVQDNLVAPMKKTWTSKVLKHMTGAGPLYIRSSDDLPTVAVSSDSESDTDYDIKMNTVAVNAREDKFVIEESVHTAGVDKDTRRPSSSSATAKDETIQCPICQQLVLKVNIEFHANLCADRHSNVEDTYASILWCDDEEDDDELPEFTGLTPFQTLCEDSNKEVATDNSDKVSLIKDVLMNLGAGVNKDKTNRVSIRRKRAWQDYVSVRQRKGFDPSGGFTIRFLGEPSVDCGGPLREFFSGMHTTYFTSS